MNLIHVLDNSGVVITPFTSNFKYMYTYSVSTDVDQDTRYMKTMLQLSRWTTS